MPGAGLPPGPRLPSALQTARWLGRHIGFMEDNRRRFGPTFTLRFSGLGRMVFITDPESAKRLFSADREHSLPAGRGVLLEPVLGPRSLLLLEGEEHLRRRKLMLPPFHGERMRAYEETIAAAAARSVRTWPARDAFAVRERTQAITFDVILRAVFGVGAGEGKRHDRLRELLGRLLAASRDTPRQTRIYATYRLASLPFSPAGRYARSIAAVDEVLAEEIADRRRERGGEGDDILSLLLAARFEDGAPMDEAEIRDQLMTLLVAGHETTATALAWAFDLLVHNPAALERAREAARTGDDAYLDAVGFETQRLRPVITSVGRTVAREGTYGGTEVGAGTSVMVSTYLMQTQPDLYPEPYEFRPERFADRRPETYTWLPFGGGVRRCIGAAFAELELRVVLREVLRRVELSAADPRLDRPRMAGITLVPAAGVRLRARTA